MRRGNIFVSGTERPSIGENYVANFAPRHHIGISLVLAMMNLALPIPARHPVVSHSPSDLHLNAPIPPVRVW